LLQQFLSKLWEPQGLEVAVLGKVYTLSANVILKDEARPTEGVRDDMRPASVTLKGGGAIRMSASVSCLGDDRNTYAT
jgi:hypothetical protein